MAVYWVDPSGGNAANDGLDFFGFGLSGATFTNASKTLTKTGAFSSYTWNSGDLIYISGGTGVTAGLYEIASKTDSDNIVLVADIGGTNPTDVTSSSGPLANLSDVLASSPSVTLAAGDEVRLCATATESLTSDWIASQAAGSVSAYVLIRGMDGTNGTTPATYTIQMNSGSAKGTIIQWTAAVTEYILFRDITWDANGEGTRCVFINADGIDGIIFERNRFTNATGDGCVFRNTDFRFIDCQADNNGGHGLTTAANRGSSHIVGGKYFDNGGDGIRMQTAAGASNTISGVVAYGNTDSGIALRDDYGERVNIDHCTCDGNGADGITLGGDTYGCSITNCALTDNGGYGLVNDGSNAEANIVSHNFYGSSVGEVNTSGDTSGTYFESAAVDTGDADYADAANGDFTPASGSALIGAGMNGSTIGAVAPADGGGGGTDSTLGYLSMAGGMQ